MKNDRDKRGWELFVGKTKRKNECVCELMQSAGYYSAPKKNAPDKKFQRNDLRYKTDLKIFAYCYRATRCFISLPAKKSGLKSVHTWECERKEGNSICLQL
jgi:hypothetical protein